MTSLTDPEGNATTWTYGPSGAVATETITVDSQPLARSFEYDAVGNLIQKTDRNDRVTKYTYDNLLRQTTESWYDDINDTTANLTYTTTYDTAGRVASVTDGSTETQYAYSILGRLVSETQDLDGMSDEVTFSHSYDANGRKVRTSAAIGSTSDYINEYEYDNLGRVTRITQSGTSIAEKRIDLAYADDGLSSTLTRYADLDGTEMVASTKQSYDALGRVQSIRHEDVDTVFADYSYEWDAASRITEIDFDFAGTSYDDTATYTHDDTNQLTDADYASQDDEDYTYDDNGNRTMTGYQTGDHNRLLSDGTYYYTYDNEGNRTGKYSDAACTVPVQLYTWDHRNRLIKVEMYDSGVLAQVVEYAYDHANRRYLRTLDANADSTVDERSVFVYDEHNNQVAIELTDDGTGDVAASDVSKRLLFGTNIDQILAEEHVGAETYWTLTDHLNTVRDLLTYNLATHATSLAQHNAFSSFGELVSTPTVKTRTLFTARPFDYVTMLQDNLHRSYDAPTGTWLTVDPIGFEAGDVNLYRYVGNSLTRFVDPSGLDSTDPSLEVYKTPTGTFDLTFVDVNVTNPGQQGQFRGDKKGFEIVYNAPKDVCDGECESITLTLAKWIEPNNAIDYFFGTTPATFDHEKDASHEDYPPYPGQRPGGSNTLRDSPSSACRAITDGKATAWVTVCAICTTTLELPGEMTAKATQLLGCVSLEWRDSTSSKELRVGGEIVDEKGKNITAGPPDDTWNYAAERWFKEK